MSGKNQHVVPNKNGGWNVKGEGNSKSTLHTDTKAEAVKAGREFSINQHSELVIHGRNGQIQNKDSHGHDPHPPKG
ncbi:hypothetical protein FC65_GL000888 [Ligilactobacillus acidipiscis DSM 15836]|uniref:DUF2188 domain-containing protein n=2 Tax=Ligilactobacillus acidipiscis TaxID=89059 RepID=A0A1K1KNY4_9LACO|nr:DUF2188 domain-containing protein [Ligilactobacillus acidipiscis]KRM31976.1 hypothetical protein FC65_GL000888 [Ligilactobacillus acidipiscis DSM 15836]GAW63097.1 hypothetical protein Lacidipiscis_00279 [Ligilactobacillus acidipiscis]GEN19692.1 hypothetical protein LAC02_29730 [Ligilactobacillus acidipiscis]SFV40532.1 hypothetical protein LAC1533_1112 [Ligilactobacillus acidipiscis]